MNKLATILLLFILSNSLYATDQQPDILIFEGKEYKIRVPGNDLPLASCPRQAEILKEMYKKPIPVLTSCWRLHYATYEIIDNILYLKSIKICHEDRSLNLKKIFGKDFTNKRVKVDWYTGELECGTHYHHIEAFRFKLGEFYEKLNYDNSKTKYSRFPWKFEAFIYENAKWEQLPKIEPNEIISVPVLIETNDTNEIINVSLNPS